MQQFLSEREVSLFLLVLLVDVKMSDRPRLGNNTVSFGCFLRKGCRHVFDFSPAGAASHNEQSRNSTVCPLFTAVPPEFWH